MPPPFADKINESHITSLISSSEKESEREFIDSRSTKRYLFTVFIIMVLLFLFLTIYLLEREPGLYTELLKGFVFILTGSFGGFGFKSYLDRNRD